MGGAFDTPTQHTTNNYDILHNDGIISAHQVYIQYIYPTTSKG